MARTFGRILIAATAIALSTGSIVGQRAPKAKPAAKSAATVAPYQCVQRFEAKDWSILLAGMKTVNAAAVQKLYDDEEYRTGQINNLKQIFSFSCQAVKDGMLNDPAAGGEVANIRSEITASEFEKIANKGTKVAPLSTVSKERVAAFYKVLGNEAKFQTFLNIKVEMLSRQSTGTKPTVSDEEKAAAREAFAKISLLAADSRLKAAAIDPGFAARVGMTVKLQQAQFLSRLFVESKIDQINVTDDEVAGYITKHPELQPVDVKAKADSLLKRARAGEDFAKLADENSDDPGNNAPGGGKNGGLYADVAEGKMIPAFEATALALEPGAVSPVLTETDYGYHIIKLEKKSGRAGGTGFAKLTYDVRHILISNAVKDPANPGGRDVPVKEYVRGLIEDQKNAALSEKTLANNPVVLADIPPDVPAKPATGPKKPRH